MTETVSKGRMEKIVSLCKRRGFIFNSSEIYGGLNSCYDYGPLGVELKRRVKDFWWNSMVRSRSDIEGLDASILMHPKIWEASGHIENFTDPMVDCRICKGRFRADQIDQMHCPVKPSKSIPACGADLTEARQFNLMFKTFMGPLEDANSTVFLRPETAQGIYVNFHNVAITARQKVPFGIAQIGKAFRNEITPGNLTFRTREFEQMEMQFFVHPSEDEKFFHAWKEIRWQWYLDLGISKDRLRFHAHEEKELAHYAKAAFDIEYEFPFGWHELEGIHNRTDFDLKQHEQFSKKSLSYFDEARKEKYIPYVIETSAGCDRSILSLLCDAYREEEDRVVLGFSPKIAPIQVAVMPLLKKDGLPEIAHDLINTLKNQYQTFYDESGSIGRRYRRQDEIGTPFCITIDHDTKEKGTLTVRHRDSMEQTTLKIGGVLEYLQPHFS